MYLIYNILQQEKVLKKKQILINKRNYQSVNEDIALLTLTDVNVVCKQFKRKQKMFNSILSHLFNHI